ADRNRSHWSTSKTPSYTKSVSWQHHHFISPTMQLHAINIDNLFPDITIYINYHHASSQNHFLTELITILMNDREASRPKFNHSE
ncbi:hypothetical protein, partial [Klebsiella pneumoniae]